MGYFSVGYDILLGSYRGYFLRRSMEYVNFFQRLIKTRYRRMIHQLRRFEGILIVLATLIPVPYTLFCLVAGVAHFPFNKFARYVAVRCLRCYLCLRSYPLLPAPYGVYTQF